MDSARGSFQLGPGWRTRPVVPPKRLMTLTVPASTGIKALAAITMATMPMRMGRDRREAMVLGEINDDII